MEKRTCEQLLAIIYLWYLRTIFGTCSDYIKVVSLWINVLVEHSKQTIAGSQMISGKKFINFKASGAQFTTQMFWLFFCKWMWTHAWSINACLLCLDIHGCQQCCQFIHVFTLLSVPSRSLSNVPRIPTISNPCLSISGPKTPPCPQNSKKLSVL